MCAHLCIRQPWPKPPQKLPDSPSSSCCRWGRGLGDREELLSTGRSLVLGRVAANARDGALRFSFLLGRRNVAIMLEITCRMPIPMRGCSHEPFLCLGDKQSLSDLPASAHAMLCVNCMAFDLPCHRCAQHEGALTAHRLGGSLTAYRVCNSATPVSSSQPLCAAKRSPFQETRPA